MKRSSTDKVPESAPAYLQVKSQLAARVGRQWTAGTRLPTIRALARQLRAGQRNTHRAVRELVAEGRLISAPRRGTFVAASKRVYLPLGECDGMKMTMALAFEAELARRGIVVTRGPRFKQMDLSVLDYDAIVLIQDDRMPVMTARPEQILCAVGTSCIFPQPGHQRTDLVSVDQAQSASLAGRFLRDAGVTDVCFIGTGDRAAGAYRPLDSLRLAGFEEGLGATVLPRNRLYARRYGDESGAEMVGPYLALNPRPRAVFAVCDDVAIGFLLGALGHGLVAGRDFDVIGFDGQWRGQAILPGPLCTVGIPGEEMGRAGAELLVSRLENPDQPQRTVLLGCTMLPGGTVQTPQSTALSSV